MQLQSVRGSRLEVKRRGICRWPDFTGFIFGDIAFHGAYACVVLGANGGPVTRLLLRHVLGKQSEGVSQEGQRDKAKKRSQAGATKYSPYVCSP